MVSRRFRVVGVVILNSCVYFIWEIAANDRSRGVDLMEFLSKNNVIQLRILIAFVGLLIEVD